VTVRAKAALPFPPGSTVRVSGDSTAGAWTRELPLDSGADNPGIGALWARAKIAALHDEERRGADAELTRIEVIDTAITHHLVSKYTSLVAVDKTPVRPAGDPLYSERVPNLLPYGQSMNAIFGFPATATNALVLQRRGLMLLLAALLLFGARALRRSALHSRQGMACPGTDAARLGARRGRQRTAGSLAMGGHLAGREAQGAGW
jgi:Ca-activated chloride channel family protein